MALHPDIESRLEAELREGERVLWSAAAVRSSPWGRCAATAVAAATAAVAAAYVLQRAFGIDPLGPSAIAPPAATLGAPASLLGLTVAIARAVPLALSLRSYALTDQRFLVLDAFRRMPWEPPGHVHVFVYVPDAAEVEARPGPLGAGVLVFGRASVREPDTAAPADTSRSRAFATGARDVSFPDVPQVEAVAKLVRETFGDAPRS